MQKLTRGSEYEDKLRRNDISMMKWLEHLTLVLVVTLRKFISACNLICLYISSLSCINIPGGGRISDISIGIVLSNKPLVLYCRPIYWYCVVLQLIGIVSWRNVVWSVGIVLLGMSSDTHQ